MSLCGVVNINKEQGYTSHDVVALVRKILKAKAGHTGTLDPQATGVLPVCVGPATRLAELISAQDKAYETVLRLGVTTDTQDVWGKVLSQRKVAYEQEDLEQAITSFTGKQLQTPPMYSAVKVDGKRLYSLAREGKDIQREAREITVSELSLVEKLSPERIRLRIVCSKGTYIRALCNDIGEALGCGGIMEELVRIRSGSFDIKDAHTLDQLRERGGELVLTPDKVLAYKKIKIKSAANKYLYNGNKVSMSFSAETYAPADNERVLLYDESGELAGVYTSCVSENIFKPFIMLRGAT